MRLNLETNELFTNAGELVKVLHCPLRMRWVQLIANDGSPHRTCGECSRVVLDTSALSDAEVLAEVRTDPSTCLAVKMTQANVTLLPTTYTERTSAVGSGPMASSPR